MYALRRTAASFAPAVVSGAAVGFSYRLDWLDYRDRLELMPRSIVEMELAV